MRNIPDIYFRDIFVKALGDKELRRAVLLQRPTSMEAAYTIACQIEAINVYDTPVQQADRKRHRLLVMEEENPENSLMET